MSLYSVDSSTGDIDLLAGSTKYADNPIGTILPYGGTTAPSGWFLCQGQAISRTDYSDLFAVIGTAFGSGNGSTTFNIPDLRGEFLRGAGTNSHTNQGNGGTVGQHQDATEFPLTNSRIGSTGIVFESQATDNTRGMITKFDNFNLPLGSASDTLYYTGHETAKYQSAQNKCMCTSRPTNTSVNYIIKAKHIPVPADFKDAIDDAVEDVYGDVIPNNASSSNKLVTRTDIPNINPLVEIADCNSIFYGLMYCGSNTSHKPVEIIGGMLLSFMSGTVQNPVGIQIFIPYNGHRVADFYFRDNTNDFSPWRKLSGEIID